MKRLFTSFILISCLYILFFGSSIIFASTTGKISGLITDAENNQPLPGTNVVIEGTFMGASSDIDGYYFILNVPPGTYSLKISQIGYKEVLIRDVKVSSDMTTIQDISVSPTVLETDEVVVVEAERPLVRMDMTSSLEAVSGDEIDALPVQEINDVLALQAGIIRSRGSIHIRGGRSSEVAYWVDGISITDSYNGSRGVTVENSSIDEIQVISGTFNAEYGEAMSGVVNMITKEGGGKYKGRLKVYAGDYVSSDPVYNVLENYVPDSSQAEVVSVGDEENPLKKFNPIYNGEVTLSGPVPLLGKYLSFFTNTRYIQNEGYLYGRELFTPYGYAGDSSLVSMSPSKRFSTQEKVTLRLGSNLKINYNVFYNQWENEKIYGPPHRTDHLIDLGVYNYQTYKYVPGGIPQQNGYDITHIVSMNHTLSAKTFYELKFNYHYNEYKRYVYKNPNATPDYLVYVHANQDEGIEEEYFDPTTAAGMSKLDSLKELRTENPDIWEFEFVPDPDGPDGYIDPSYKYAPTGNSYHNDGMDMDHERRSTEYWTGKFDITSQINNMHLLKGGLEFKKYEINVDEYTLINKTGLTLEEQLLDYFRPAVPSVSSPSRNKYTREPIKFSAYLQDKIEIGNNIIINAGLRFDYFDAKSVVPKDPRDPDIYNPVEPSIKKGYNKEQYKYKNWQDYPDTVDTPQEMEAWESQFEEYEPDERRALMHREVDAKMQLSPRLGIAYPISSKGVIHFSYGHFFQVPEFQYLYTEPDFKVGAGSGDFLFGNADLEPQKTVMYEIGLQQQLSEDIGIDVTLFYRDIRDWIGTSPVVKDYQELRQIIFYENKDYSNVRGITFKFEKRQSHNFSTRLDYTFQIAEGTYSNPIDAFNAFQNNDEPRKALIPLNWDQRHTLNASIIYNISDWTISLIGHYWSGMPYTPSFSYGDLSSTALAVRGWRANSARIPSQKEFDLYINKRFYLGAISLDIFCNIYNLFDTRNPLNVYGDTGTPDHNSYLDPGRVTYNETRVGTIDDYERQPSWYSTPREINLGVAVGF